MRESGCKYFIFDLPGQVEIYTNHNALKDILQSISKSLPMQIAAVHLVDCTYLYDRYRFLSALTLSLTATIGLEMPFINAISKIDMLGKLGRPDMNLSFYSTLGGLSMLYMESGNETAFGLKYSKLTQALC